MVNSDEGFGIWRSVGLSSDSDMRCNKGDIGERPWKSGAVSGAIRSAPIRALALVQKLLLRCLKFLLES